MTTSKATYKIMKEENKLFGKSWRGWWQTYCQEPIVIIIINSAYVYASDLLIAQAYAVFLVSQTSMDMVRHTNRTATF